MAAVPRVRAYGRDLIRAKGILASGACKGRIKGRTHGRTNQQKAEDQNATCQRRAVHTRPVCADTVEKLGLALLRHVWFNLDLVWMIALIMSGALIILV